MLRTTTSLPIAFLLLVGFFVGSSYAQEGRNEDRPSTREERLQQHEERVREIIQKRRAERLNSSGGASAAVQDGRGEVDGRAGDTEESLPSEKKRTGRVILYTVFPSEVLGQEAPLDTIVKKGERFKSVVRMSNERAVEFDRVRLAVKYDKRFIRPVKVFDREVRAYTSKPPKFEKNDRDGILIYDAPLSRPIIAKEADLLTVVWEAVRPSENVGLGFQFATGETEKGIHTGIYSEGNNILGDPSDPTDGVLGGSILIMRERDSNSSKGQILQGKREELRELYLEAIGGADFVAGLQLSGPMNPPIVGEEFHVDVQLYNPMGAQIDSVRFFLKFDPDVLEVVDKDRGNWIKRGINAHDGLYAEAYPFDYHKKNEANNQRGSVAYAKATSRAVALPSGTFARIYFKAKQPVAETRLALIEGRQGAARLTSLESFGYNMLTDNPDFTKGFFATEIVVPTNFVEGEEDQRVDPHLERLPKYLYDMRIFPQLDIELDKEEDSSLVLDASGG